MPKFIEPIVINGINKDVSPDGLDYSGRKVLNPVRDVLNGRYLSSESGDKYQVDNIYGTTLTHNTVATTGQNKCIGTFEDPRNGNIIYFIYNTDGYNKVMLWNVSTSSATTLLQDTPSNVVLNFQNNSRYYITGVSMIGDILIWTDNYNHQRYANISRAVQGFYGTLNDFKVSLIKSAPSAKPTFTKVTNGELRTNRITDNNIQFAFRYVFIDNEVSAFSPYSELALADAYGIDLTFSSGVSSVSNVIAVQHDIDPAVFPIIKRIELLFRINNNPDWRIWRKVTSPSSSTVIQFFSNDSAGEAVSTDEASKIFDNIPNKSKALTVFRNRVFLNVNEEGFTVPSVTISATRGPDINTASTTDNGGFIKKNGTYRVGLVEYDKFGRATGIIATTIVKGSALQMDSSFNFLIPPLTTNSSNRNANRINATVSGTGILSGMYSIAITPELEYENYMQVPVHPRFYKREFNEATGLGLLAPEQVYSNKVFYWHQAYGPPTGVEPRVFSYIYLNLPDDIPFMPDNTYFVRIINKSGVNKVEKVIDVVEGNNLVVGNFGFTDWTSLAPVDALFVEIFKLKNIKDLFYYEVAGPFGISSNGSFSAPVINGIKGDTYYRGASLVSGAVSARTVKIHNFISESATALTIKLIQYEQPTPIYTKSSSTTSSVRVSDNTTSVSISTIPNPVPYVPDYTKSAWSRGRPFVEATAQVLNKPSTIRYSDPYIEGSQINGLNSFGAGNEYTKIGEDKSPITKLIGVGNILVAVHERNITSLYVGEGVVKSGDTGFLSKTDDVIGDDRKLLGNMGSYHPESVQEVDGMLFGWDIFLGVVWRYTAEGVYAISNYGMKDYFRDKSQAYLTYKDSLPFVAGIDRHHKEYILALPHVWSTKTSASDFTLNTPVFGSSFHDITLNPNDYVVGKVYRVSVRLYKTGGASSNQTVSVIITHGGNNIDVSNHSYIVNTSNINNATELLVEWMYDGSSTLRIHAQGLIQAIKLGYRIDQTTIEGETWAFNYEEKVWSHRYSFVPEYFATSGNTLYGFKYGRLWKFNDNSAACNTFFGLKYPRKVRASVNPEPNKAKVWNAVQIVADSLTVDEDSDIQGGSSKAHKILLSSTTKVFEASNEHGQETYTRAKEFEKRNGVYYGPILKDVNTNPSLLASGQIALRDGKDMSSKSLEITVTNTSARPSRMQKINIVGEHSMYSV